MWFALALSACSTPTPEPAPAAAPPADAAPAAAEPAARPAEARGPANRAPTIDAVTIGPEAPTAADILRADVKAHDPENGRLDFDYEWFVNDVRVLAVDSERLGGRFQKGDTVRVRVVADDGTTEVDFTSEPVTIGNRAPVFETGAKDMRQVDGFAFRASDPDGDALTWKIEGAPRGMSISPKGVLAYQGAEDEPGGRYTVVVKAEDGEAFAAFEFPLTVTAGSKAKTAGK